MDALPELIERIPTIISTFANVINDNAPTILMTGVCIILDIIKGLIKAIPTLILSIPKIIKAIIDVWSAFNWLSLGKNVITAIGNGLKSMAGFAGKAMNTVKDGIVNVIKNLPSTLGNLAKSAMYNLGNTISGLRSYISGAVLKIFSTIETVFLRLPSKIKSIGSDIIKGLWNGISNMTGWILDKISGFGNSVLKGIKKFFGIKSPSRLMRDEVGTYITQGIGVGIEEDDSAEKAIGEKVSDILGIANSSMANIKVGTSVDGLMPENPINKYQLDFNAQFSALSDGFENLIALVGEYLPNIASGMDRQLVIDGSSLAVGISRQMDNQLGRMAIAKGRGNV